MSLSRTAGLRASPHSVQWSQLPPVPEEVDEFPARLPPCELSVRLAVSTCSLPALDDGATKGARARLRLPTCVNVCACMMLPGSVAREGGPLAPASVRLTPGPREGAHCELPPPLPPLPPPPLLLPPPPTADPRTGGRGQQGDDARAAVGEQGWQLSHSCRLHGHLLRDCRRAGCCRGLRGSCGHPRRPRRVRPSSPLRTTRGERPAWA